MIDCIQIKLRLAQGCENHERKSTAIATLLLWLAVAYVMYRQH
ncbi:hypothetical protein [Aetokthonos hydrillicola]|nr:hypothetical protein [Aetokthonos hydrillicola]